MTHQECQMKLLIIVLNYNFPIMLYVRKMLTEQAVHFLGERGSVKNVPTT